MTLQKNRAAGSTARRDVEVGDAIQLGRNGRQALQEPGQSMDCAEDCHYCSGPETD